MRVTRNLLVPLLDRNKLTNSKVEGYDWVRIDKSTMFNLAMNPVEESFGYIDAANDYTEITGYQPELPQEIIMETTNPLYAAMREFFMRFPVGSAAQVPFLLCMPNTADPSKIDGFLWEQATVSTNEIVGDEATKLTFTVKLNGDKKDGNVTVADGTYTFEPAA